MDVYVLCLYAWLLLGYIPSVTSVRKPETADIGYFWHVTDMHWDPSYSETSAALSCNEEDPDGIYGKYGSFLCDSPWTLINSSVYAMKRLHPDPDFLIWTGDDTPHIYDDTILHQEAVVSIIFNLTDKLTEVWPDTIVYSALGNHDWWPKNQLPPRNHELYNRIGDKWKDANWLTEETAEETFKKGGYYTMMAQNISLRIVVLNTNLYYDSNEMTRDMPDPANQMQWLDDVLTQATEENTKVLILAHVPPGKFEKHMDKHWYYSYYNQIFVSLLRKHADIIGSVYMAHHHTDSFRVVYDEKGSPVNSMMLAPAVCPWETTLPGVMGGAGNNPSIRLVKYDRKTGVVLDVIQYYLDLREANENDIDNWKLEYEGTEYYGLDSMSHDSLNNLAQSFLDDDAMFSKYYQANGVLYDPEEEWEEDFRTVHYCAITEVEYLEYNDCVNERTVSAAQSYSLSNIQTLLLMALFQLIQFT